MATTAPSTDDNQVLLRGRLAVQPISRTMPSGDELTVFRLTVARPPGGRVRVDSIDCSTTSSRVRRTLARANAGDQLEITGCLRRRFWRGPAGLASRYEVDALTARVTARQRSVASPARKQASV